MSWRKLWRDEKVLRVRQLRTTHDGNLCLNRLRVDCTYKLAYYLAALGRQRPCGGACALDDELIVLKPCERPRDRRLRYAEGVKHRTKVSNPEPSV